jgi:hypothetical protein
VQLASRLYAYIMLALALPGGFIVVATFAFGQSAANEIGIGVAAVATVATVATVGAGFIDVEPIWRGAALLTCLIAAWAFRVTVASSAVIRSTG